MRYSRSAASASDHMGDPLARGHAALADGAWDEARDAFAQALMADPAPEAFDGLGRALWWLSRPSGAVTYRLRAYRGFRRSGDQAAALRIALWLAREYTEALGRPALGSGWLARAEELAVAGDRLAHGWIDLARSELSVEVPPSVEAARRARDCGRRGSDADLEIRALAQLGLARVRSGEVDDGMASLDEATSTAIAEPETEIETLAEACCKLVAACELVGDPQRTDQWADVIDDLADRRGHRPLLALRASCRGAALVADGQWDAAESELVSAVEALEAAGETVRCVRPAAHLAELRVRQGRLEEAAELLAGRDHLPEAVGPLAALRRAQGDLPAATRILRRRLSRVGDAALLAAPLLAVLVEAELDRGDSASAREAAERIALWAERAGGLRLLAEAQLAAGRVATAIRDPGAPDDLEAAVQMFSALRMPYQRARAQLDLAEARARAGDVPAARAEAEAARAALTSLGARRDAEHAEALLRRVGPAASPDRAADRP